MRAGKGLGKFFVVVMAAVAVWIFAAAPSAATTYYVSQSTGSDTSNGQAAQPEGAVGPWKTLARASANNYVAGDRILLKCGDAWNEELHPKGSGTPESPITIGAYGGGKKPLIDRQDYKKDLCGIHLADQEGFKIVGVEFARCMTGIYGEYSVGCPTKKFISIEDCCFHDSLLYGHYENYPKKKIGLGVCFFSHETKNKIVLTDVTLKNCVFLRLASGIWTNSPDNFNKNAGNIYNFGNFTMEDCLFEGGHQWQQGIRGVAGGAMRRCVTHDIGRNNRAFNGVAGAMFCRSKNWVFEDCEWGFISLGPAGKKVSGDGEAFDFESNCDHMTMRNCLFHDTEGPGFLLCCYASGPEPEMDIHIENCVLNGKATRTFANRTPKAEIMTTTNWNEVTWKDCRFYLSKGEILMACMDPEKDKRESFVNCRLTDLSAACSSPKLEAKASTSYVTDSPCIQLDFGKPVTVNEFKIEQAPSSTAARYVIQCWDDKQSKWVGCFNGNTRSGEFVAPIVSRTTQNARLVMLGQAAPRFCRP